MHQQATNYRNKTLLTVNNLLYSYTMHKDMLNNSYSTVYAPKIFVLLHQNKGKISKLKNNGYQNKAYNSDHLIFFRGTKKYLSLLTYSSIEHFGGYQTKCSPPYLLHEHVLFCSVFLCDHLNVVFSQSHQDIPVSFVRVCELLSDHLQTPSP